MAGMALRTPRLHTPRLRLRPFTIGDTDALFALHSSVVVLRYWDAPRADPVEPRVPQRVVGVLPRGRGMGPRLRDGGRARPAAVGIRHPWT